MFKWQNCAETTLFFPIYILFTVKRRKRMKTLKFLNQITEERRIEISVDYIDKTSLKISNREPLFALIDLN